MGHSNVGLGLVVPVQLETGFDLSKAKQDSVGCIANSECVREIDNRPSSAVGVPCEDVLDSRPRNMVKVISEELGSDIEMGMGESRLDSGLDGRLLVNRPDNKVDSVLDTGNGIPTGSLNRSLLGKKLLLSCPCLGESPTDLGKKARVEGGIDIRIPDGCIGGCRHSSLLVVGWWSGDTLRRGDNVGLSG